MSKFDDERGGFPCPVDGMTVYPHLALFDADQGNLVLIGNCPMCRQWGRPAETYARVIVDGKIVQEALNNGLPWVKSEEDE